MSELDKLILSLNREFVQSIIVPPTLSPDCGIFVLGEAPGKEESIRGMPFVGASGKELRKMLGEVGISSTACTYSNVFNTRPPDNNVEHFFTTTKTSRYFRDGLYLPLENEHHITRVYNEIQLVKPNIILALGQTALWATTGRTDIGSVRGIVLPTASGPKLICTHHPARVLREWSLRVVALADLAKCQRESERPGLVYDKSEIWINPDLPDLHTFERRFMSPAYLSDKPIACDIETLGGLIRCVGFAPSESHSLVIPFIAKGRPYWPDAEQEAKAWEFVKHVLTTYEIMFHNGAFDVSYFLSIGIIPRGYWHDTMILHHALYPELRKSLEFLGSIYAHRPAWKMMRPKGGLKTEKREA